MIVYYFVLICIFCIVDQYAGINDIRDCGRRIIQEPSHKLKNTTRPRVRRIVRGENAYHGQWPWIVSLKNPVLKSLLEKYTPVYMNWSMVGSDSHICGGTLINSEWILTAKHCVFYNYPPVSNQVTPHTILYNWTATLGSHNIVVSTDQEISIPIDKVVPLYDWDLDDNDFAMMHLSTPVNFTDYIIPVCLPNSTLTEPGTICYAVGWGTVYSLNNTLVNPVLKHATLKIMGKHESKHCTTQTTKEICTSPLSGSVCRGDSGGPLLCQDVLNRWVIVGITSRGSGCQKTTDRSIFTSIYHQLEFVYRTINSSMRLSANFKSTVASFLAFLIVLLFTSS